MCCESAQGCEWVCSRGGRCVVWECVVRVQRCALWESLVCGRISLGLALWCRVGFGWVEPGRCAGGVLWGRMGVVVGLACVRAPFVDCDQ